MDLTLIQMQGPWRFAGLLSFWPPFLDGRPQTCVPQRDRGRTSNSDGMVPSYVQRPAQPSSHEAQEEEHG